MHLLRRNTKAPYAISDPSSKFYGGQLTHVPALPIPCGSFVFLGHPVYGGALESRGCIMSATRLAASTATQNVHEDVAELFAHQTVDDEVDGRVERQ